MDVERYNFLTSSRTTTFCSPPVARDLVALIKHWSSILGHRISSDNAPDRIYIYRAYLNVISSNRLSFRRRRYDVSVIRCYITCAVT